MTAAQARPLRQHHRTHNVTRATQLVYIPWHRPFTGLRALADHEECIVKDECDGEDEGGDGLPRGQQTQWRTLWHAALRFHKIYNEV